MKQTIFLTSIAAALFAVFPGKTSFANDTAAMGTAANVQFVKNKKVVIHQENLAIGPLNELNVPIHVRYEMENLAAAPEEVQVAFPLPECSFEDYFRAKRQERVSRSETCVKEPKMQLAVDGKKTEGSWTTKLSIGGTPFDQTEESKKSQVTSAQLLQVFDLMPETLDEENAAREEAFTRQVAALCRSLGGKPNDHGCDSFRKIRAQRVFLWKHSFLPRKRTVVSHDYVVESSHNEYAEESFKSDVFCLKDKSVAKAWDAAKRSSHQKAPSDFSRRQHFVGYVLKTGSNWAAPIGEFNFTLKKANPKQFVSTCFDGLKKTSSLEFRASRKNFLPKEDLYILFFDTEHQ